MFGFDDAAALAKGAGLAKAWIPKLYRRLRKIRKRREDELKRLADIAGGTNPVDLAKVYVEPDVQLVNPADHRDDNAPPEADRKGFRKQINFFLERSPGEKDGRHVLFLLAGAGMGKTSALIMLYMSQYLDFWPKNVRFELLKLGDTTLDDIAAVADQPDTILLLDSLDEDPLAFGDLEERTVALLDATRSFRQVVVTCRTQFFPETTIGASQPTEKWGHIKVGGYRCGLFYLAPFSTEQAREYLRKRFPVWNLTRIWNRLRGKGSLIHSALEMTEAMGALTMRPLLLAYVEDLIDGGVDAGNIAAVYERLVDRWIDREVRKLRTEVGKAVTSEALIDVCERLAEQLRRTKQRSMTIEEISQSLSSDALDTLLPLDIGGRSLLNRAHGGAFQFAHKSIQEFLWARSARTELEGWESASAAEKIFARSLADLVIVRHTGKQRVDGTWRLAGADLADMALQWVDLTNAELTDAFLSQSNLEFASLTGANLRGASLAGAIFFEANLDDANLRDCNLRRARFEGSSLQRAAFGRSNSYTTFAVTEIEVDKSAARLNQSSARSVVFARSSLDRAHLEDFDLTGSDLEGASLREANLQMANLGGANLKQATLLNANLEQANLRGANLRSARLGNARLGGADLRDANLTAADLQDVDLSHARLEHALLSGANLYGVNIEGAVLHHTLLPFEGLAGTRGLPRRSATDS